MLLKRTGGHVAAGGWGQRTCANVINEQTTFAAAAAAEPWRFVEGIKPGERCLNKPTQLCVETANGFRALPCTGESDVLGAQ